MPVTSSPALLVPPLLRREAERQLPAILAALERVMQPAAPQPRGTGVYRYDCLCGATTK